MTTWIPHNNCAKRLLCCTFFLIIPNSCWGRTRHNYVNTAWFNYILMTSGISHSQLTFGISYKIIEAIWIVHHWQKEVIRLNDAMLHDIPHEVCTHLCSVCFVVVNPWPLVDINKILENTFQAKRLVTDSCDISNEITLRWTSLDLSDDESRLVQVIVWCRQATSHYLNQCWPKFLPPYGVTRPQTKFLNPYDSFEYTSHGLLLITWINFNPRMDK